MVIFPADPPFAASQKKGDLSERLLTEKGYSPYVPNAEVAASR